MNVARSEAQRKLVRWEEEGCQRRGIHEKEKVSGCEAFQSGERKTSEIRIMLERIISLVTFAPFTRLSTSTKNQHPHVSNLFQQVLVEDITTSMTWTELHDACEHQDAQRIVKIVNEKDAFQIEDHGWTPLHILCWGNPEICAVRALLESCPQAALNKDAHGNTPLHVACAYPAMNEQVVHALLKACPLAAEARNREGLMPLHMACRYIPGNVAVIKTLVTAYPQALKIHSKV